VTAARPEIGSRRRLIGLAACLVLAGCTSPNPTLYTLEAPPGPIHLGAPKVVEMRMVALARYLERDQIVRSSENFHLQLLHNDWWGEPLDAMIGRVLIRALSQRLPESTIYLESGAISAAPDATVEVNVQRMDRNRNGAVRLIAQFAIIRHATITRAFSVDVPIQGGSVPALVAAMSTAMGDLADRIAVALAAR
jgi:uncharacterized protein